MSQHLLLHILHYSLLASIPVGLLLLSLFLHQRGRRGRQDLAERFHNQSLALSQRCDHLQDEIDRLRSMTEVDHLHALVAEAREAGALPHDAAEGLGRYILKLKQDAKQQAESPAIGETEA